MFNGLRLYEITKGGSKWKREGGQALSPGASTTLKDRKMRKTSKKKNWEGTSSEVGEKSRECCKEEGVSNAAERSHEVKIKN